MCSRKPTMDNLCNILWNRFPWGHTVTRNTTNYSDVVILVYKVHGNAVYLMRIYTHNKDIYIRDEII